MTDNDAPCIPFKRLSNVRRMSVKTTLKSNQFHASWSKAAKRTTNDLQLRETFLKFQKISFCRNLSFPSLLLPRKIVRWYHFVLNWGTSKEKTYQPQTLGKVSWFGSAANFATGKDTVFNKLWRTEQSWKYANLKALILRIHSMEYIIRKLMFATSIHTGGSWPLAVTSVSAMMRNTFKQMRIAKADSKLAELKHADSLLLESSASVPNPRVPEWCFWFMTRSASWTASSAVCTWSFSAWVPAVEAILVEPGCERTPLERKPPCLLAMKSHHNTLSFVNPKCFCSTHTSTFRAISSKLPRIQLLN